MAVKEARGYFEVSLTKLKHEIKEAVGDIEVGKPYIRDRAPSFDPRPGGTPRKQLLACSDDESIEGFSSHGLADHVLPESSCNVSVLSTATPFQTSDLPPSQRTTSPVTFGSLPRPKCTRPSFALR